MAEARRTGDRAALADALELRGAADAEPGQPRLRAAIELWDDVDDPVGAARARLALAVEHGRAADAASARHRLAELAVAVDIGAAGYLVARRDARPDVSGGVPSGVPGGVPAGPEVLVATLGRFAVVRRGEPVALAAWQSRKARDLFKLLIARRGRPLTREAAVEALWPEQDAARPGTLGNRLSVALSTIRKVLDPDRAHPPDHYLAGDSQSIALRLDHLSVDVVEFLDTATPASLTHPHPPSGRRSRVTPACRWRRPGCCVPPTAGCTSSGPAMTARRSRCTTRRSAAGPGW